MAEPVELTIAGQSCRVVSSASAEDLARLAAIVEEKLADVNKPGRPLTTQTVLLAAIALAHDMEEQRQRADSIVSRARVTLNQMLGRVDEALAFTAEASAPRSVKGRASKSKTSSKAGRTAAKKSGRGVAKASSRSKSKAKPTKSTTKK